MPAHPDRPNILLICTDQQSAHAMSCTGNQDIHTPTMDGLAQSGVRFTRAYCTQPLCGPSRASLFTGRMPHEVGMLNNRLEVNEEFRPRMLGRVLANAGYECAYGGKWHVRESTMPNEVHGFETISTNYNRGDLLAEDCSAFLRRVGDKPFFLVASFHNPHGICEWCRDQKPPGGDIDSAVTESCPSLPGNYAVPPFEAHAIRLEMTRYPEIFAASSRGDDVWWRHYRHAYNRMVEKVDAEIGTLLSNLDEYGLAEDTVVIFTSDHGDMQGAHQMNQKHFLYEEAIRVPLIIKDGRLAKLGQGPRGSEKSHLVSNGLDIFPTICDYAEAEAPHGLPGQSLRPFAEGQEPGEWRDQVCCETFLTPPRFIGTQGAVVRTDRYKYTAYNWGRYREQLIDLETDPGEMINLTVNTHYRDILDEHRTRFQKWCDQTGYTMKGNMLP